MQIVDSVERIWNQWNPKCATAKFEPTKESWTDLIGEPCFKAETTTHTPIQEDSDRME